MFFRVVNPVALHYNALFGIMLWIYVIAIEMSIGGYRYPNLGICVFFTIRKSIKCVITADNERKYLKLHKSRPKGKFWYT